MSAEQTLQLFYASLRITLPTFGWVMLGLFLHRVGVFPAWLNDRLSRFGFNIGLPLMLFCGAALVDYTTVAASRYLLAGILATLFVFVVSWRYTRWRNHPPREQGLFVQAAFRSNLAIVGVSLCVAAYGEAGTAHAAMPVAVLTVLYNMLAVFVLDATLGGATGLGALARGILKNPLIIGISLGILLSVSSLPAPDILAPMSRGLSAVFLPMVLVCIGGSMNVGRLYRAGGISWEASAWRLVLGPFVGVCLALAMGVQGVQLGVLFLLLATPVAASSHVMVAAARGDAVLAANMIVLTTLLSIVSVTAGFFLLSLLGLVDFVGH